MRVISGALVVVLLVSACATETQQPPEGSPPAALVTEAERLACEQAVGEEKAVVPYYILTTVLVPPAIFLGAVGGMGGLPHGFLLPERPWNAAQENAKANLAREEALRACLAKGPVEGPALARRMLGSKEPDPVPVAEMARAVPTVSAVTWGAIEWPRPSQDVVAARAEKPRFKSEPGPEPESSKEEALIRSIQEGLRRVGYTWVPVDGRLGSWTRAAIRDFQSSSEWAGRIMDEKPSVHLLVDINRATPKWDAVLQPLRQPADAKQK